MAATQKPLAVLRRDVIGLDALTRPRLVSPDPGPNKPTKTLRYPCQRLFPSSPWPSFPPCPSLSLSHCYMIRFVSPSPGAFRLLGYLPLPMLQRYLHFCWPVELNGCGSCAVPCSAGPDLHAILTSPHLLFLNRCRCIFCSSTVCPKRARDVDGVPSAESCQDGRAYQDFLAIPNLKEQSTETVMRKTGEKLEFQKQQQI